MMSTRTFRGTTLEEVLPQIRDELGGDAVVVRQRDGVVGGIGGFFGKRCVEVDARPAVQPPSLPPRAVIDVYDNVLAPIPSEGDLDMDEQFDELEEDESVDEEQSPIVRRIADQARPFAEPARPFADELARAVEDPGVERALVRSGVPDLIAADIVAEAESRWAPLYRDEPLSAHVSRVLASRIPVADPWPDTERRRIAIVGERGSGRTTAAVELTTAFRGAGVNTAMLSLEPARSALRLFERVDLLDIPFEIAPGPEEARLATHRLESSEVIVADTPAFGPGHGGSVHHLAQLLDAFDPQEIHLVVGANTSADRTWLLVEELRRSARVDRLLLAGGVRAGAAAALVTGVPVSFISMGTGVHPAQPTELAAALLKTT
jgi:flagellar biosynthesis protein FlhF